jgi:p-hydroxybenzoate 3-monooxygenase
MILSTQVGIIGAGPAGLLLQRMLHNRGIESIILENRNEAYLRQRLRAGVQEQETVDTFIQEGVGQKLQKEKMIHEGIYFHYGGKKKRLDIKALSDGKVVTVYGQKNITCDMMDKAHEDGLQIEFEAKAQRLENLKEGRPIIHYSQDGKMHTLECDYIAGCDGFHGISRPSIPSKNIYEYEFPYSWYGVLAEAEPISHEVIYAHHPDGFALQSMRGPQLSRLYIQCPNGVDPDTYDDNWFWDQMDKRLDVSLNRGPIIDRGIAPMRSFISDKMQHGKLFIAGDAAHIVPPTGAKGMNLAVADIRVLAKGLNQMINYKDEDILKRYTDICLRRIWKVERFSWWLTTSFHIDPNQSEFETKMQIATLSYLTDSKIGGMSFAENYIGLPILWEEETKNH